MNVLLSIKPEFANKIFSGDKRYEYRKTIFKRNDITRVVVYATAPISRIIGEFEIESILFDDVNSLWEETKAYSGIDEQFFFEYFTKKEKGYAIKIKSYEKYQRSKKLDEVYCSGPPQSFAYID
ncbi:ASCH domain-containing protein [Paenibacillus whitsoniae]|uniref:ASCH domain-containing protein n=1 Tax=Paenibacillus whitsoniae TaxID=2496558 RepID=A0A430JAX1_9BACL|nr:ASCH domain-containing protein [Paenibacillus whitsoniae]RTE08236.1 ASCH domain-containing protein [Paenibacillus whitsoniae]